MAKPDPKLDVPAGKPFVHDEVVSVAISGYRRTPAEKAFDEAIAQVSVQNAALDAKLDSIIALLKAQGVNK